MILSVFLGGFNDFRGAAGDDNACGYVTFHNRSCTDDCVIVDSGAGKNNGARTDETVANDFTPLLQNGVWHPS